MATLLDKVLHRKTSVTAEASKPATVDAMLVLCVHEANVPVQPAAGSALKKLARKALARMDPALVLSKDAYVRFGLIEQDPTGGVVPGFGALQREMAEQLPPGVDPRRFSYLMGFKPVSDDASERLPGDMKALLVERGLEPGDYELRPFTEEPDRGVTFFWMAAIRK
jgi:hypothetical protein